MSTSTKKVTLDPLRNTSAFAQPYLHEKQQKTERMTALQSIRKNGMEESASPRTIYNTWKNDNGAWGGKKTKKRRMRRRNKTTKQRRYKTTKQRRYKK